ncbi:A24 family peptidase [Streptomyces sp. DSM 41982]|uniref:A24 family peptidase n=2 Tax=Streptomyces TaxID=1883 RepID=A0ABD5E292_9ACTN|nr:A24 family peptidase [Streptomyces sp. DSM 41982]MDT0415224.1 A24 family peptidase [Streptomyces sp. DSM 41982]
MTSAAGLAASPAFLAVCAAVWGALAGAFLPRAAHRFAVPAGEPWSTVCPEGDPVRGWVGVRACPAGHGPSPYPYALGTALVCALLAAATGPRPELFVWLLLAPPGILLFRTDLRVQRLPDPLTLTTAPLAAALLGLAALHPEHAGSWPRALLGAVALAGGFAVLFLVSPSGLGFGDVKLALLLGLALTWYGWGALFLGVFAGFLLAALYGLVLIALRRATRRTAIPFGPALLAGAYLGVLAGAFGAG